MKKKMNNYSFSVFWSDNDSGYIAICPEFPGISAFGETSDEALTEVQVALRLAIETYKEEGWALPEPRIHRGFSGQFRLRMPKALHAKLALQAQDESVSLNTLVVTLLSEAAGFNSGVSRAEKRIQAIGQDLASVTNSMAELATTWIRYQLTTTNSPIDRQWYSLFGAPTVLSGPLLGNLGFEMGTNLTNFLPMSRQSLAGKPVITLEGTAPVPAGQ